MRLSQFGLLGCLALAACSTTAEPKVRTVEVKVPVRVACVPADTAEPPASYPDARLPTAAEAIAERFQLIAAANEARKARLALIEPIVAGCR
jgi:hypothetical protein